MIRRIAFSVGFTRNLFDSFSLKAALSYSTKNKFLYRDLFATKCYEDRLISKSRRPKYEFDSLVLKFADESALSSLTNKEFLRILDAFIYYRMPINEGFKVLLKKECFNRQPSFDNISVFYCADILKKSNFHFDDYMQALLRILMFRWNEIILSKEDALLLAYFLCSSKSPTIIPVMDKIENFFKENISVMTPREVGLVCHLFFSTNNRIKEFNTIKALEDYILTNFRGKCGVYPTDLNNMIKVFRHAHHSSKTFFQHLGDMVCNDLFLGSCNFTHLSNLAFSYASLNIRHDHLLDGVTTVFCNKLIDSGNRYQSFPRLKDFSRLLWSRAFFCLEVTQDLKTQVLKLLRSDPSHAYKFPEMFLEALTTLAILETYDMDMLKLTFSSNFINFKLGRTLEQDYQLLLLRRASSIEGGYCAYTNPELNRRLDAMIPSIPERLNHDMTFRQGLFATVDTLHKILGDWSLFKVHFILDFSRITDIELHVDESGIVQRFADGPQDIMNIFECMKPKKDLQQFSILKQVMNSPRIDMDGLKTEYDSFHLKNRRPCFPKKICIKVLGQNQYSQNSPLPNGHCQLELRLIHKLGYEVFVIDPNTAKRLEEVTSNEKIKMLTEIMSKCGLLIK